MGGGDPLKASSVKVEVEPIQTYPVQHCHPQELLHCTHSTARNFKEEWQGGTMHIGVRKTHWHNALSERKLHKGCWGTV